MHPIIICILSFQGIVLVGALVGIVRPRTFLPMIKASFEMQGLGHLSEEKMLRRARRLYVLTFLASAVLFWAIGTGQLVPVK